MTAGAGGGDGGSGRRRPCTWHATVAGRRECDVRLSPSCCCGSRSRGRGGRRWQTGGGVRTSEGVDCLREQTAYPLSTSCTTCVTSLAGMQTRLLLTTHMCTFACTCTRMQYLACASTCTCACGMHACACGMHTCACGMHACACGMHTYVCARTCVHVCMWYAHVDASRPPRPRRAGVPMASCGPFC